MRNELETHLTLLKRQGLISSWHDRRITAGSDFDSVIDDELESSQIVLLLISAYFLASDYCYKKEMHRALQMHKEGLAVVIPVILHPCDWQSAPFGQLMATPIDGKAISMFANQHEAMTIVSKAIREVITSREPASLQERSLPMSKNIVISHTDLPRSSNLRVKRKFDDHERDQFLEDGFEYIGRFFDGSLLELEKRNPKLKTRFKRLDATSFSASVYEDGKRVAECSIWYGNSFRETSIAFSFAANAPRNSFNESLSVVDDGYSLQLKPLGMQFHGEKGNAELSQQGAAEYFWELLIRTLQ